MSAGDITVTPPMTCLHSLESLWAINEQNDPRTDAEKTGLKFVIDHVAQNDYATKMPGGLDKLDTLVPAVRVRGQRHVGYGVLASTMQVPA